MLKDRIKEARKKCGLTQLQVAEQIGVAKTTYTGYETGNSSPDMLRMAKIMKVLGVDANFLLQDEMAEQQARDLSDLTDEESHLLSSYRKLNAHAREMALGMVETMTLNPDYLQDTAQSGMAM